MAKTSKKSKASKKKTKDVRDQTTQMYADNGSDALARKIWLAGVGAFAEAQAQMSEARETAFGELVSAGKASEAKLMKQLGSKKKRAGIQSTLRMLTKKAAKQGEDRFEDTRNLIAETALDQREKLEARMRQMREVLGLQNLAVKPKKAEKLNSKLDALEEQVAAIKATSDPIDNDVRKRVERLSQEIADLAASAVGDSTESTNLKEDAEVVNLDARGRLASPVGTADDLTLINGVGPVLQSRLNEIGVYHLWQIADLSDNQLSELETDIGPRAGITRNDWRAQAKDLISG
ncbi:MAG: hypothetical protein AAGJ84_10460 [Pseudomonadota bacterium]